MRRDVSVLPLLLLAASMSAYPDTFLRYTKTTDPYRVGDSTVPAATTEEKAWIGSKQASFEDGEGHRSIIAFATRTLTIIDLEKKTFSTVKLDSLQSVIDDAVDANTEDDATAAAMKSMMQGMMGAMMKGSMTVEKTSEQRKIGSWQCTKYLINIKLSIASTASETWLTEQIKIDPASFNMLKNGLMALLPGFGDIEKEFGKIKGIPVKTITTSQAMNTTIKSTELLAESAEKAAPEGIYTVSKGFREQPIGSR